MLNESDPCFDPCSDNVVAKLCGSELLLPRHAATHDAWREAREPDLRALSDMQVGRLFRDLYENGVGRDWDALSRMGEISAEISLCRISSARDDA